MTDSDTDISSNSTTPSRGTWTLSSNEYFRDIVDKISKSNCPIKSKILESLQHAVSEANQLDDYKVDVYSIIYMIFSDMCNLATQFKCPVTSFKDTSVDSCL